MARSTAPTKDEKALVALGRREERRKQQLLQEEEAQKRIKAERNELRKDNEYLAQQVQEVQVKGSASHRGLTALSGAAGTAAGATMQHFLVDPTAMPGAAKKGLIPALGGISGLVVLVLADGAIADCVGGFLLGTALGSGVTTGVKSVA